MDHAYRLFQTQPELNTSLDEESFQQILYHLSRTARKRPYNLAFRTSTARPSLNLKDVQLIDLEEDIDPSADPVFTSDSSPTTPSSERKGSLPDVFVENIVATFSHFLSKKPLSRHLAPPCLPGLTKVDATVQIMVDIIHAVSGMLLILMISHLHNYYALLACSKPIKIVVS